MGADLYWERITYFLERVIPVAEEYKVRMACHPHDPGMPRGKGYRGVETVLGSVDGLKQFIAINAEPVPRPELLPGHGLGDARRIRASEIFDVIRYFGSREQDLQRALPQHPRRLPRLPGDVPRRRRRGHAARRCASTRRSATTAC